MLTNRCTGRRADLSLLSLLGANLFALVLALVEGWALGTLMWIYWAQSVIIGLFNFFRILSLDRFSTEGLRMNGRLVKPTRGTQLQVAFFFLFHYGFFHVIYAVFLASSLTVRGSEGTLLALCIGVFFVNHLFSFGYNLRELRAGKPNLGYLLFFPYARILPLHLTIVFGLMLAGGPLGLLVFLGLKTVADLIMHAVEHSRGRVLSSTSAGPPAARAPGLASGR
jgi:hypothetical protein